MIKDLTGLKFTRLKVTRFVGMDNNGRALWECRCDCGSVLVVRSNNLRKGNSKSCGCLTHDILVERNTKYQNSGHPIYQIWRGIIQRCNDKNCKIYKYYGGKGVRLCERWDDYENFYSDMISGYKKGLTIDRINTDGGYEPDNCRWASQLRQANNKTNNKIVTAFGMTASLADVCREFNADYKKTWKRLWRGWPIEKALTA